MNTPIPPDSDSARQHWNEALAAGPLCLSLERLAEPALDAGEQAHVQTCPRCHTERALMLDFEAALPADGEGAAVEWIARETRRRLFPEAVAERQPAHGVGWWRLPTWATSMAAGLAIAVGAYLMVRSPSPVFEPGEPGAVYRTAAVEMVSPLGDLDAVPAELTWRAVDGAARYEVRVLEVDGTEIWRTTTSSPSVATPDVVRAAAKPARTLAWAVAAMDASGRPVAEPASATFRVAAGVTPQGA
ncbi:MAG: hypothetical protein OEW19_06165 [Acidobacteriota bacterium]|nr:hypothetical protein [Acidobacteriota bacterium]